MAIPIGVKLDCTCCNIVAPRVWVVYESVGDYCSGCGVEGGGTNGTFTRVETNCTKGGTFNVKVNVIQIPYLIYGYYKNIQNYAAILKLTEGCFLGHSTQEIQECNFSSGCDPCYPAFSLGSPCCVSSVVPEGSICCTGISRPSVTIFENPITSCSFNDFNYIGELSEGYLSFSPEDSFVYHGMIDGDANHFFSRYGNMQNKKKTRFKIKHEPTISCYLKIWIRKKITRYTIRGSFNTSYDAIEVTYEDFDEYVWNGSGNPCFNNIEELAGHPDNIVDEDEFREVEVDFTPSEETVEAFEEWNNELNTSTQALESTLGDLTSDGWAGGGNNVPFSKIPPILGGGIRVDLEFKFSIAEGYEPNWPNE